jgi:ferritin-like metal-binding protein YciE
MQKKSSNNGNGRAKRTAGGKQRSGRGRGTSRQRGTTATRKNEASGKATGGQQRSAKAGDRQEGSTREKFFVDQLKDIYYAEQKILQSLPKMKEAATTDELQEAFIDHLHQTERHVRRLDKVFQCLGQTSEGKRCDAIEGILKEAEEIIGQTQDGTLTRDAALIIAAQKVEHYEIATYGGLLQLAIAMDLYEVADLLDRTLVEEEDTDALLTNIAEMDINLAAEHEGNAYSWEQEVNDAGEPELDGVIIETTM